MDTSIHSYIDTYTHRDFCVCVFPASQPRTWATPAVLLRCRCMHLGLGGADPDLPRYLLLLPAMIADEPSEERARWTRAASTTTHVKLSVPGA